MGAALAVGGGAAGHETDLDDTTLDGPALLSDVECHDGHADQFSCRNVDLLSWIPVGSIGPGPANDIWGWTDPHTGREVAILGHLSGAAFVDVSDPANPVYLGLLPNHAGGSRWRDIKVHRGHAYVVSEARGHGMKVFDLHALDHVIDPPVRFTETAHYAGFGSAHNLAVDETTGFAYAVGSDTCGGGLHMVDIQRPQEPRYAGCFGGGGYSHDAQCVVYHGPDTEHAGREICFGANASTLAIIDVTSKNAPRLLSQTGYAGRGYAHQGWLTEDHARFLLGDELDEFRFGHPTRVHVWDLSDLDAPFVSGTHTGTLAAIDHNLHVRGNHVFLANYRAGLRVLRIGDLDRAELAEVASFDTHTDNDGLGFRGAWGVYPFFESRTVVVSDINRGLFVLRPDLEAVPECSDGVDNDLDGRVDHPADAGCADPQDARELPRSDVAIDVLPGKAQNRVSKNKRGAIQVAILGSESFDVEQVDPLTLALGPEGAACLPPGQPRTRDVDGDGFLDLLGLYPLAEAGLSAADGAACLRWQTRDGTPYRSCDELKAR
jgi:choice-of-anchor B domain-containing protein